MKKEFKKNEKKKSHQSPKNSQHFKKSYQKKTHTEIIPDGPKIQGIYSQSKNNNFGFIDVEDEKKGYFVYPTNTLDALDGDSVEAYVKTFRGRQEAVITKVTKRAQRILVGKIELVKDFAFVILDNLAFRKDVYLPSKHVFSWKKELKNGIKVAIQITKWEGKNPEGKIVEILGKPNDKGVDIMAIALEGGARIEFPENVLQEAKGLTYDEGKYREDLSQLYTFTIDGEDAKDLDDAITLEKIKKQPSHIKENLIGGYRLIVSIADVAHYVKEKSFLDKEALKRGNSTYLVDRVIPMLPEKLSNDLCSLNPNTKKLTLSAEIYLNRFGDIVTSQVYESIIVSKQRFTYKEVQYILEGKLKENDAFQFGGIVNKKAIETIQICHELKELISKKKREQGVLDFDFPETKIILDENGFPVEIKKYERYESMRIIEEFMILANQVVGEMFHKNPFVYRIHPVPNEDDIEKLRTLLHVFNITLPYKKITPKLLNEVLEEIKKSPKEKLLSKLTLRSLEKAIYSQENEGHFGLGLNFYSHFTSPIRRYPDLQIHRIIKEILHKKFGPSRKEHYFQILPSVCKHTSETERRSEKLEYAVRDLMMAKYYQNKIGQVESGTISGMIPAGFFVELENTAEGFVSFEQVLQITGHKKGEFLDDVLKYECTKDFSLQVGDPIEISIESVEMERRRLNFNFIKKI